jgi:hypothetical protein
VSAMSTVSRTGDRCWACRTDQHAAEGCGATGSVPVRPLLPPPPSPQRAARHDTSRRPGPDDPRAPPRGDGGPPAVLDGAASAGGGGLDGLIHVPTLSPRSRLQACPRRPRASW